jgi:phosphatidylserine decarboxylase
MAKSLREWIDDDVREVRAEPLTWLSQYYFFRDPTRPAYVDPRFFFSPADGVIVYQRVVGPDESVVDIKGKSYSLREALRDGSFDKACLVIGVFMTFFDVHVNRIPYSGRLSYREFNPIDTMNCPMLDVEKCLLDELRVPTDGSEYLRTNQRVVNRVDVPALGQSYFVLQVADYDVDSITPFKLGQNQPAWQGQRFSQIRYGSQVDLIIPVSLRHEFVPLHEVGQHVQGGTDALVRIRDKGTGRGKP